MAPNMYILGANIYI